MNQASISISTIQIRVFLDENGENENYTKIDGKEAV